MSASESAFVLMSLCFLVGNTSSDAQAQALCNLAGNVWLAIGLLRLWKEAK